MCEMTQKLVSTSLFNFHGLKLSTRDIIAILKDTLNITSGCLSILDPHATRVPSNTLERHSIGSCVVDDVRDLVINFSMAKLVALLPLIIHSHIRRVLKTPHLWICYSTKVLWIAILSTKSLTHFPKVVPSERTSIATRVAIVDNIKSTIQVGGHTPRVVLLDTSAQPVILGVQFAKNMGMFDSKLRKSMANLHC
jgi:hypothetical protein